MRGGFRLGLGAEGGEDRLIKVRERATVLGVSADSANSCL